jgi:hypothetical protein
MTSSSDAAHNRANWDRRSDEYQAQHAEFVGRKDEPRWGMWQLPESELQVLGERRSPTTYRTAEETEWARRWPMEEIWRCRKG